VAGLGTVAVVSINCLGQTSVEHSYIDFGGDRLLRLETYDNSGLPCIFIVSKRKFVHDAMTEESSDAIASRFYPISFSADCRP
jgi:hypothetical protein